MIEPSLTTRSLIRRTKVLYASEAVEQLLARNGLHDLDAVFARGAAARCRHHGRAVYSEQLIDQQEGEIRVFIKLNWGRRRVWPRMSDLKAGQVLQSLPVREWNGLRRLRELGLYAAEPLAVIDDGLLSVRAAVIVRAVPPQQSIFDMLVDGRWSSLAETDKERLLQGMVDVLLQVHSARLAWRGTCCRHFFPEQVDGGEWKLWLIDCEGVHGNVTRRHFERDYGKLVRSMQLSGADRNTIDRLRAAIERQSAAELSLRSASIRKTRRSVRR